MGNIQRTIGAKSELRVALDIVNRGYEVFAPIVEYQTSCDLVAIDADGGTIRVEVKTSYAYQAMKEDRIVYSNRPTPDKQHKYDLLALVLRDGSIVYEPPLPPIAVAS